MLPILKHTFQRAIAQYLATQPEYNFNISFASNKSKQTDCSFIKNSQYIVKMKVSL